MKGYRTFMGRFINSIFNNDSILGQITTRLGILTGANLMFILFSLPVVTIGPAAAALSYVCFKTLRSDGVLNPFKTFWQGFKMSFKQSFLCTIAVLLFAVLAWADLSFIRQMEGPVTLFKYPVYVIIFIVILLAVFLVPVIAVFEDTLPHQIRNAIYFAAKNPVRMIIILAVTILPLAVTYLDQKWQPLYAFIWAVIGFAGISMLTASMLLKDVNQILPPDDDDVAAEEISLSGDLRQNKAAGMKMSQQRILEEMKKLDE